MVVVALVPAFHELSIGNECEERIRVLSREIRKCGELLETLSGEQFDLRLGAAPDQRERPVRKRCRDVLVCHGDASLERPLREAHRCSTEKFSEKPKPAAS
jgi:hypothetical protein